MNALYQGVPIEILDRILGFVHLQDPESLRTCSYVDTVFCSLAQQRLLEKVKLPHLYQNSRANPAAALLRILKGSPHIANYVRSLSISCDLPRSKDIPHCCHWLISDDFLPHLIPLLPNIQSVSLTPCKESLTPVLHYNSTAKGITNLLSSLHNPLLTCLDLRGIQDIPAELLGTCLALTHLSISSLRFDSTCPPPDRVIRLHYFHVDISNFLDILAQFMYHPAFPFSVSHLKTLSIRPALADYTIEHLTAFAVHARSVRHIHICAKGVAVGTEYIPARGYISMSRSRIPDLHIFPNVKSVSIDAVTWGGTLAPWLLAGTAADYYNSPLPWINSLFQKWARFSAVADAIEQLTINLAFKYSPDLLARMEWQLENQLQDLIATVTTGFTHPVKLLINVTGLDKETGLGMKADERLSDPHGRVVFNI